MKFKTKQTIFSALAFIIILGGTILAGSLIPTGPVGTPTMYTLSDIYNKLNLNTYTPSAHTVSTTSLPTSGTFNTLTEIWNSIPTISASTIATGTTIMGIAGTNPAYAYGSSSASQVLTTAGAGAGTANDPATGGADTQATTLEIISGYYAFGADGLVIDGTGSAGAAELEWSADDPTGYVDWATAGAYCTGLGGGYRLPHLWELLQYFQQNGRGVFQSDYYWSSTEHPYYPFYAFYVFMGYGDVYYDGKTYPYGYVRCAR
jgi:hypothetical protein